MKTVLIIEDDHAIAEMVREVIEDEGYRVITAGDGRAGMYRVARDRPDLVLSDVMMPHLTGWDVCRTMHADPHQRTIPVVIMTAAANIESGAGCPYAAFVEKPIDWDLLLGTITRLIGRPEPVAPTDGQRTPMYVAGA